MIFPFNLVLWPEVFTGVAISRESLKMLDREAEKWIRTEKSRQGTHRWESTTEAGELPGAPVGSGKRQSL